MFNFEIGKHFEIVLKFAPLTGIIAEVVSIEGNCVRLRDLNGEFNLDTNGILSIEKL